MKEYMEQMRTEANALYKHCEKITASEGNIARRLESEAIAQALGNPSRSDLRERMIDDFRQIEDSLNRARQSINRLNMVMQLINESLNERCAKDNQMPFPGSKIDL